VTQGDGVTPLSGAAVSIYSGPTQKGTTHTDGTGDYTIAGLHPGSFTVRASNVGYRCTLRISGLRPRRRIHQITTANVTATAAKVAPNNCSVQ
jgi:hypothetical protein